MSFSFSFICTADSVRGEYDKALDTLRTSHGDDENRQETLDLASLAAFTAMDLVHSGELGSGEFSVSVSGHAEPGHADQPHREGWARDYVTIGVSRLKVRSE